MKLNLQIQNRDSFDMDPKNVTIGQAADCEISTEIKMKYN